MSDNGDKSADFKDRLVEILKNHPEGLSVADLSKMMKSHRQTVTKYILWLEGANTIYRRRIGAVTLQYIKKDWERLGR